MSITCDYAKAADQSLVNYHFDADSMTVLAATDQRVVDFVTGGGVIGAYAAPVVTPSPEQVRLAAFRADATRANLVTLINGSTPAQINTWLTNNVTSLAQARAVLGQLILLIGGNSVS